MDGDPRQGVYVRYPADELYAILCLESRRYRSVIVGEDLGTVPRVVRDDMRRRGLPGMYVLQFELADTDEGRALEPRRVPKGALASIGTHDTPTFAGWWAGRDVEIRRELGQMEAGDAEVEKAGRGEMRRKLVRGLELAEGSSAAPDLADERAARRVHAELLRGLGASDAGLVLATMEDLWLEPEPQNVPGSMREENWRRPFRRPMEALAEPEVAGQLEALNEAREGTDG
jgi:4-alpha-glucanotransferase